jgi:hypothetical protein
MKTVFRAAILLTLAGTLAAAQTAAPSDVQNEGKRPVETQLIQKSALGAAAGQSALSDNQTNITFEEILAHPDNAALNYNFARQQVRQGDLKGAAATLQRILMVEPDLPRVRLFYAVVLYRLDDLAESEQELQKLRALNITPDVQKELDVYLNAIAKRQKRDHLSGELGLGWEFDDNRNATPASGQFLFGGTPIIASTPRTSDTSALFLAGVQERHRFSGNNEAFATFDYYRAEQTQLKSLNLQAYSVTAGDTIRTPWLWTLKPAVLYDHVLLAQSTFLRNRGLDLRAERSLTRSTLFFAEVRDVFNDYVAVPTFLSAHGLSGIQLDFIAGAERALSPRQKVSLSLDYGVKHAFNNVFAYNREGIDVSHTLLFSRGLFLLSSLSLHFDQYPHPDIVISGNHRSDKTGRLSFTAGAPLSLIHPKLKDLLATFTYEYYQAISTINNYAFTNNKIAALLTYRWDAAF